MNSRKCECCFVDVQRASFVKRLRINKLLKIIKQNEMIITEWLFKEPIENKIEKLYNPKPLRQLARDNFELDEKQLNKEFAKKMINPYFFTDRSLKVGFKFTLESHHNNHATSQVIVKPNYPEFGIEKRYIDKIEKKYLLFMLD